MLEKNYQPGEIEPLLYARWEQAGLFHADLASAAKPYSIIMPPPNVTGNLHIGHALTFTIQDVLIRQARLQGRDALWQPGTDHAGIATQMVVERQLAAQGETRDQLGREAFLQRVWQWRAQSGDMILHQLRRLGASADWPRTRFTLDQGVSVAVTNVFVELYRRGLIYRDKRLVNWDPALRTAISDLEVEQRPAKGFLWYLSYPLEGGGSITVATTRPETMLGDTGIAVHPDDERYRDLVGRFAILPLVGRRIPIVADSYSDRTKGSGAVKITPAHDFNDFEVGLRHGLACINILDGDARLNDAVPAPYRGLTREAARTRVLEDLTAAGLVSTIQPIEHTIPHGDRSGAVVEPWLTDQWFCNAQILAQEAIAAVERGATRIIPKQYETVYFEWMRNIQPWCISRQIWWGHQIPAWFGPDGHVFVAHNEAEAQAQAQVHYGAHYGEACTLRRDEDVLDTWFSSALWPFSTLGWPEETPELARYYPTDVLVTGGDILFYWVARMMMMGLAFTGEVPFHTVYIHGLVRDGKGQKMSKSKGNSMDPLVLADRYGTDALRFTLASLVTPGRDVKLPEARIEGSRNFISKIWNAARFCEVNGCTLPDGFDAARVEATLNRWIIASLAEAGENFAKAMDAYRLDEAAAILYQFIWGSFCDWYLELAKPALADDSDPALRAEVRASAAWCLREILKLAHPMMPFVTECLWERLGHGATLLACQRQSDLGALPRHAPAVEEISWLIATITQIRASRAQMNVPAAAHLALSAQWSGEAAGWAARQESALRRLARLSSLAGQGADDGQRDDDPGIRLVTRHGVLFLHVGDTVDLGVERARLAREAAAVEKERAKLEARLNNADFRAKADPETIEDAERRQAEAAERLGRLQAVMAGLQG